MISFVVAKSKNDVIGRNNDLPWYLPADLKHFKEITTGGIVVMGRKTFQSIIDRNGKPLPGRVNVVLTRDRNFHFPSVTVINSIDDLPIDKELFVIGGAEIFKQLFDQADRLYLTEVQAEIAGDVFFPKFDVLDWREVSRQSHKRDAKNPFDYDFVVLDRA